MKTTRKQFALGVSLGFHAILLVVLFVWYVPSRSGSSTSSAPIAKTPDQAPNREATPPQFEELAAEQPDVSAEEVQKSVESQIELSKKLPDERKLTELEKNLKRLESIASDESVDEVSSTIGESLGLDVGQYAPKETPPEGPIDTDTAQISDVIRTRDVEGRWRYESLMVDAEGREMKVELGDADGERLYETFELMKRYPMARGVYQSVVMPMLQKMLEAESATEELAP